MPHTLTDEDIVVTRLQSPAGFGGHAYAADADGDADGGADGDTDGGADGDADGSGDADTTDGKGDQ